MSGPGCKPVQRHQCQPDRREVIHLPDRRPLLGIRRDRTDGRASRRLASTPRTTGCNKPGPTTSRSAAPDTGGSTGSSKCRSKRRSMSRRQEPASSHWNAGSPSTPCDCDAESTRIVWSQAHVSSVRRWTKRSVIRTAMLGAFTGLRGGSPSKMRLTSSAVLVRSSL